MVQDDVEYNRHCELMKSFKSKDVKVLTISFKLMLQVMEQTIIQQETIMNTGELILDILDIH